MGGGKIAHLNMSQNATPSELPNDIATQQMLL